MAAEALRLIGSFVNFVREENPDLASKLMVLAAKWAMREKLPLHELAAAVQGPGLSKPASGG